MPPKCASGWWSSIRKTRAEEEVLDVREQEVYVGELPLMTERGHVHRQWTERRRQPVAPVARRVLHA